MCVNYCVFWQLFSVLFFLMLFTLGIGSAMGFVNCVITVIRDRKPEWRKECIAAAVCVCGFLSGLVYVTPVSNLAGYVRVNLKL